MVARVTLLARLTAVRIRIMTGYTWYILSTKDLFLVL
jgi:hypothetical protein